jgi:hypothetical protein
VGRRRGPLSSKKLWTGEGESGDGPIARAVRDKVLVQVAKVQLKLIECTLEEGMSRFFRPVSDTPVSYSVATGRGCCGLTVRLRNHNHGGISGETREKPLREGGGGRDTELVGVGLSGSTGLVGSSA